MKSLLRKLYKYGYPFARVWWFIWRPTTEGVRVIIKNGDSVLLIKHTYGHSCWSVPGGGLRKNEPPAAAAARETKEEVGIEINDVKIIATFPFTKEYKNDTIHVCTATTASTKLTVDTSEIKEARWFKTDNLPEDISETLIPYLRAKR